MKMIRIGLPAMLVGAGLMLYMTPTFGTPAYSKKEKTACATCHTEKAPTKAKKDLNKAGNCYKDSKDMSKCK